jgi:hypothetical protein
MIYFNPAPVGEVTLILPVAKVQVDCITLAVGIIGVTGCALTIALVDGLTQPSAFFTNTLYVPVATPLKLVAA